MKNLLSSISCRSIILTVYTWLTLMGYAIVYIDIFNIEAKRRFYIISVAEVLLLVSIFLSHKILQIASKFHLSHKVIYEKSHLSFLLRTWLMLFVVLLFFYLLFYPGGFSSDNISQYAQVISGHYNDHHPVFHTLFSFTLPLKITQDWSGSIILFQIFIFSFTLAYLFYVLKEYGSISYAKFFLVYILLNPAILSASIIPLKDTIFAITAVLLTIFSVRIYFTRGLWLSNIKHLFIFMCVMVSCTLFRHNAILFTLPLFFAVSLYIKKKQAIFMFICFLSLIYLVRYPLYDYLNVERPVNNRQIETLGLPMTIIGNAVKEAPEKLDNDVLEFAHKVAPQEIWNEVYELYRGFNSIKFASARIEVNDSDRERFSKLIDLQAIEKAGWKKVLRLMLNCFKEASLESLRGMFATTNTLHGLLGHTMMFDIPDIAHNNLGLKHTTLLKISCISNFIKKIFPIGYIGSMMEDGEVTLQGLISIIFYAIMVLFKYIFQYVGLINFIILTFILTKLKFNKIADWKRVCLVLPVLSYNFGTMFLLSGPNSRFFYYSYLVFPLILLILLKDTSEANEA